jgi:hypothetical protein
LADLLAEAISKGTTVWLRKLLTEKLPLLPTNVDGCVAWYSSLLQAFESRNLIEPSQQKNFLTQVRNAIKVLNPEHPALKVVKFDLETWVEINNTDVDRIANRTTQLISNPDAIVETAIKLIKSYDWSEIAAGLAVLTGRRSTEVIKTAQFEYKSEYSVLFSGSLKRRGEPVECVFEIPTLCKARLVIGAIANLRNFLGSKIQDLSLQQISGQYSRSVSKKCDQHFEMLVPNRTGKDNLYTHLFRAVYATIASYWYCPPTVPENEYRAAIQGHYQILDEKNPELRRSLEAGRHYHDYKIADGLGNIDGRLGIKLDQLGVEIIEAFVHVSSIPQSLREIHRKEKTYTSQNLKMNEKKVTIPRYLNSRFAALAARLGLNEKDTLEALFDWTEVSLSLADLLDLDEDGLKPNVLFDKVEELAQSPTVQLIGQQQSPGSDHSATLNKQNISDLCAAINSLASTVANQQVFEKGLAPQSKAKRNTKSDQPQQDSISKPNAQKTANSKRDHRTEQAEAMINYAIDKIIEHNNLDGIAYQDKYRVGIGAIRKLTGRGDGVIRRVLNSREDEISAHHKIHKLSEYHNSKGNSGPSIEDVISLDPNFNL